LNWFYIITFYKTISLNHLYDSANVCGNLEDQFDNLLINSIILEKNYPVIDFIVLIVDRENKKFEKYAKTTSRIKNNFIYYIIYLYLIVTKH